MESGTPDRGPGCGIGFPRSTPAPPRKAFHARLPPQGRRRARPPRWRPPRWRPLCAAGHGFPGPVPVRSPAARPALGGLRDSWEPLDPDGRGPGGPWRAASGGPGGGTRGAAPVLVGGAGHLEPERHLERRRWRPGRGSGRGGRRRTRALLPGTDARARRAEPPHTGARPRSDRSRAHLDPRPGFSDRRHGSPGGEPGRSSCARSPARQGPAARSARLAGRPERGVAGSAPRGRIGPLRARALLRRPARGGAGRAGPVGRRSGR